MKKHLHKIIAVILLVLCVLTSTAQTPEGINYQAVIRNTSGLALNTQSVSVRFSIRENSGTGTVVFTETHATITNQFGLVTLVIGGVNTTGLASVNWGSGTYFLQIEVDTGTGFDDLGATQLMSVPYALYAKTSSNGPQGLPGENGENGQSTLMDTASASSVLCPNGGQQIFIGLDTNENAVLDSIEVTGSFVVCNGDDGATGPSGLPINWLGTFSVPPTAPNVNDAYYFTPDNISFIYTASGIWDTLVAGGLGGMDIDWTVVGNDMYSLPTGNLGIGLNNPTRKLSLVSNDSIVSSFSGTDPNVTAVEISNSTPTATTGLLFLSGNDTGVVALNPSNNRMIVTNNTLGGKLALNADSAINLSSNNIGIRANEIIRVQSDTVFTSSTGTNVINRNFGTFLTDSLYLLGDNKDSINYVFANDGSGQATWRDISTLGFNEGLWQSNSADIFFNSGNVGIGTLTPSSSLTINTGSGNEVEFVGSFGADISSAAIPLTISSDSNLSLDANNIYLSTNATDRLTILNNGNVGIGTTLAPSAILQVQVNSPTSSPSSIITALTLSHKITGGGGASGIGTQIVFQSENTASTSINTGLIGSQLTNATVGSESSNLHFQTFSGGTLSTKMRIIGNGNVGIGTDSPTELLHLQNGTLRIDNGSNPYNLPVADGTANQVLTTNGAGVTSWQEPEGKLLQDTDGDTEINVETSADEDIIRFRLGNGSGYPGGDYFTMVGPRLNTVNPGQSVFIGENAGANDDLSANQNTFVGFLSGNQTTTGFSNAAFGYNSLLSNSIGNQNAAFGANTLANSSGNDNTAIGFNAGSSITTGINNTFIGSNANSSVNNLINATAIGSNAIVSSSNSLVLGNGANVGIGVSSPSAKLDVAGTFKLADGTQGAGRILTSDAAGNASWQSLQIAFEAQPRNAGQSFLNNVLNSLVMDSIVFNDGSGYNASTNIFTAPIDGVYSFQAQLTVSNTNTGAESHFILELLKNGTSIRESNVIPDRDNSVSVNISITTNLVAGDEINLQSSLVSSNIITISTPNVESTWFSGHLVYAK